MKLTFTPHTLYFKRPFKIAHGTRDSTPIVLTQLEHEGIIGFGEACMPPYLGENHESVLLFLNKAAQLLSNPPEYLKQVIQNGLRNNSSIEILLNAIEELSPNNAAAKASVDIALHDLIGKMQNQPCWKMYHAGKMNAPFTFYTLGIDEPAVLKQKITEAESFKFFKVKLNGENDKSIISTIRNITDKAIAIDVNQGWLDKHYALEMIEWLQDKNVLFVEQPLPKDNLDDSQWLFERSPLPLFADESIQRFTDLEKVKNCFHGINIKLMKCTGMFEANKMIKRARELNFKILIGCMSETSCAISAAAQLSPFADYADLDGSLLIKNDFFDGIKFDDGKITLNELPGIGVVKITETI